MVNVRIGNEERKQDDVDESWINQQINRRRAEGQSPCVRVTIKTDNLDLVVSTPTCGSGGGGGRAPNKDEQEVFDLWAKLGLNNASFTGGNLIAFLKQIRRLV